MLCKWYVQSNLSQGVDEKIKAVCDELGAECISFRMIPFVERMPRLGASGSFVLVGSTTLNRVAFKSRKYREGIFFNPASFCPDQYLLNLGDSYFNSDMRVVRIGDIGDSDYGLDDELFIRVNDDSKLISGGTLFFRELLDIKSNTECAYIGGDLFSPDSEVCLASVKPISGEWRLVVVQGKIVAASGYRPVVDGNVPSEVLEFGASMVSRWTPHSVCVMDVCASAGRLYVLEFNCFNGSGFYAADLGAIVRAVGTYQDDLFIS